MRRMWKRGSLLLLLFALLLSAAPAAAADGDEAAQNRTVRVGWYNSERFQEGDEAQGRKSGYSYEYLQDVANYTGWEYEYVSGGWSELYDAFVAGKIDLLAGLSYTEERADFAVAVFDLNGLKAINDTYVHESGDLALIDAGRCLKKVFGNAGIYRFGGDEFIVLEVNASLEEMQQRFGLLDWELEETNRAERPYVVPLSLAKGTAAYIPGTDTDYKAV